MITLVPEKCQGLSESDLIFFFLPWKQRKCVLWKAGWDEGQVECQRALIIFQGLARSLKYEGDLFGFRQGGECEQIVEGIPTRVRFICFVNRELLAAAVPR